MPLTTTSSLKHEAERKNIRTQAIFILNAKSTVNIAVLYEGLTSYTYVTATDHQEIVHPQNGFQSWPTELLSLALCKTLTVNWLS